jgi:argininosuccinate lyase
MDTPEKYSGFRAAGGRLSEPLRPELERHRSELMLHKLEAIHAFDKAHVVMLTEEGLIDGESGRAMLAGLLELEEAGIVEARLAAQGGLHSGEHYLTEKLGAHVGGQIHLGRSSADLSGVSRRIVTRDKLLQVLAELNKVRLAIAETASRTREVLLPSYTYGQHAQPTTYAHWLAMWSEVFARDFVRLKAALDATNRSPAGAAAVTGSDFALNRERTAQLLGFDKPLGNTMDATLSNDSFQECAAAMRILAGNVARLAEDFLFWSTIEAGVLTIPDRFCDTSSIMAQKRNPYVLHEMRALSVIANSALTATFDAETGATGQAVLARKIAEEAMWSLFAKALLRLQEMSDLIPSIVLHAERMSDLAENHWSQATDLAGALVRDGGLNWRAAHQLVGSLVRQCEERGLRPAQVTLDMIEAVAAERGMAVARLTPVQLAQALSARQGAYRRRGIGGPAPERVAVDLAAAIDQMQRDETDLARYRARLGDSAAALVRAANEIVAS